MAKFVVQDAPQLHAAVEQRRIQHNVPFGNETDGMGVSRQSIVLRPRIFIDEDASAHQMQLIRCGHSQWWKTILKRGRQPEDPSLQGAALPARKVR